MACSGRKVLTSHSSGRLRRRLTPALGSSRMVMIKLYPSFQSCLRVTVAQCGLLGVLTFASIAVWAAYKGTPLPTLKSILFGIVGYTCFMLLLGTAFFFAYKSHAVTISASGVSASNSIFSRDFIAWSDIGNVRTRKYMTGSGLLVPTATITAKHGARVVSFYNFGFDRSETHAFLSHLIGRDHEVTRLFRPQVP